MAKTLKIFARLRDAAGIRRTDPPATSYPRTPSARVNSPSTVGALAFRVPASHLTSDAIPQRENS
jgi:hypothetical protein